MKKSVCAIDGNSLMHRAFHAIPPSMTSSDGTPTNAVFGFLNMFNKYIGELAPDKVVCAFDCGKATARIEMYDKYKSSRPPMDDNLRVQFPVIEEILGAMGVPIVKVKGWEGDDILGTIAKRSKDCGLVCYVVTGDKDMNQLVCDDVFIATTDKNKELVVRDRDSVFEKFGVYPEQIIDYLALVGDTSDDIPGVPGIGAKSASQLLEKYGDIEGIYDNLADFKGKRLENLINNSDQADLSRKLATINVDLDFELDIENLVSLEYDEDILNETFHKYGLRKPLSNFKNAASRAKSGEVSINENSSQPAISYPKACEVEVAIESVNASIDKGEAIGFSFVEPSKKFLRAIPSAKRLVGVSNGEVFVALDVQDAKDLIARACQKSCVVAYDVKEILKVVFPHDRDSEALLSEEQLLNLKCFDVHVASNMIDSHLTFKRQDEFFTILDEGGFSPDDDVVSRAEKYAFLSLVYKKTALDKLSKQGKSAESLFSDIEMKLVGVLTLIERNGARVSHEKLSALSDFCAHHISELTEAIYSEAGHEFLLDSPAQLSEVLFEELGLPHSKKTKTGYSTNSDVLADLAADYKIAGDIIKYRELAKLKRTYIDALPACELTDGRVHTTFNQAATATGRLSSSNPNLQNIPVRTDFGRHIREAFLPCDDNCLFLSADYSQIELRILAHLSEDENLIEAFCSGRDFHTQTAARIFGVGESDVTRQMRSRAKAVNFGIVYGQQAFTLARDLDVSFGEAKDMIDRYYASYPRVKSFLDKTVADATQNGYALTMMGRRRAIPELSSTNRTVTAFGERTAKNHPMQGSAADIIKKAMIELQSAILERNLKSKIMIQVHDELDLSVERDEVEEVKSLVSDVMQNVVELKVPLIVDVNVADNWAEAH